MLPLCKFPLPEAAAAERCFSRRGLAHPALGYFCQGSVCRRRGSSSLLWHRSTALRARPRQDLNCCWLLWKGVTLNSSTPSSVLRAGALSISSSGGAGFGHRQVDRIPSPPAPRGCSQHKGLVTNFPALRDDQSWAVHQAGRSLPFRNMFNQGRSRNMMSLRVPN